jgi:hypothetical protein
MPPRVQQANMCFLGYSGWIVIVDIRTDYGIYTFLRSLPFLRSLICEFPSFQAVLHAFAIAKIK